LISNPTADVEEIVPITGSTETITGAVDLVQTIIPTSFSGGGQPHNNMPPYVVMKYMIRAKVIV
jgi:microcystin-dependent protein